MKNGEFSELGKFSKTSGIYTNLANGANFSIANNEDIIIFKQHSNATVEVVKTSYDKLSINKEGSIGEKIVFWKYFEQINWYSQWSKVVYRYWNISVENLPSSRRLTGPFALIFSAIFWKTNLIIFQS